MTQEAESPNETVEGPTKEEKKGRPSSWLLWTRDIVICLILVLLFRANVAEANYIPSPSMEPTLHEYDRIIVEKLSMHWRPLERGDLIVFHPPLERHENERWIKRVIGLPGETIEVIRGVVYVNGHRLEEPYIQRAGVYSGPPIRLSEDDPSTRGNEAEYYLLGDNRRNSRDSHVWGPCSIENIIGRAVFRYWPPAGIGGLYDEDNEVEVLE